jgi:serine phosphatase RsbU (regulator of sigma subunit)
LAEKKIKLQANEIQESIQYAWRIQQAMLPGDETISKIFPRHFIFYKPRNTVSGDFYWVNKIGSLHIIAVADCTGHGVPGAFMSMMGISLLNEIVLREKITSPAIILNTLRERLKLSLKSEGNKSNVADGMDISLAIIDNNTKILQFAGAYNPLFILRKGELLILEADRMPVGEYINDTVSFTEKTFTTQHNDRLILFTDGFKDQNGGEKNKKYSSKQFKELLVSTSNQSINGQIQMIEQEFDLWKSEHEQVDDVLIMGIEID